jgi:dolichol-phosphate mannosyltransferase
MYAAIRERLSREVQRPLELSVVIPTLNERDNVLRLFGRLAFALDAFEWEAIFVDDGSTDGTVAEITELARFDRRVRLITRFGRRGLASAVVEGMLSSTAPVVAVIDADLQHDETLLPHLVKAVASGGCDLAIGSRYATGGSIGEWSDIRAKVSRVATKLAGLVMPRPLADPMSGFFAVDRAALVAAAPHLTGTGYKLLLDLVASSPVPLRTVEFPYRFQARDAGESKLDAMVMFEYAELILDKTVGRFVPTRFILFAMVGTFGLVVHLATLWLCLHALGLRFSAAMLVATVTAMTFNFALNNVLTYRDRRRRGLGLVYGLLSFYAVCSLGAFANVGVGTLLYGRSSWWLAGAAGAAIGSVWNFAVGGVVTWRTRR